MFISGYIMQNSKQSFTIELTPTDDIDAVLTAAINERCPDIAGWVRTLHVGGVFHNASVKWLRETSLFKGCIVCFIDIDRQAEHSRLVTMSYTGWLAEYDHNDGKYYTFEGSYLPRFATLNETRLALRELSFAQS